MAHGKRFSNIIDLHKNVEAQCRKALEDTLEELSEVLYKYILRDVYMVKKGSFYQRTRILLIKDMITTKLWNAFSSNKLGGTLSFDEDLFDRSINVDDFQHGNRYEGELTLQSYLEIVNSQNDWDNPYGFPMVNRKSFWDDFLDWIDGEGGIGAIYQKHLDKYVKTTQILGRTHYTPTREGLQI